MYRSSLNQHQHHVILLLRRAFLNTHPNTNLFPSPPLHSIHTNTHIPFQTHTHLLGGPLEVPHLTARLPWVHRSVRPPPANCAPITNPRYQQRQRPQRQPHAFRMRPWAGLLHPWAGLLRRLDGMGAIWPPQGVIWLLQGVIWPPLCPPSVVVSLLSVMLHPLQIHRLVMVVRHSLLTLGLGMKLPVTMHMR